MEDGILHRENATYDTEDDTLHLEDGVSGRGDRIFRFEDGTPSPAPIQTPLSSGEGPRGEAKPSATKKAID